MYSLFNTHKHTHRERERERERERKRDTHTHTHTHTHIYIYTYIHIHRHGCHSPKLSTLPLSVSRHLLLRYSELLRYWISKYKLLFYRVRHRYEPSFFWGGGIFREREGSKIHTIGSRSLQSWLRELCVIFTKSVLTAKRAFSGFCLNIYRTYAILLLVFCIISRQRSISSSNSGPLAAGEETPSRHFPGQCLHESSHSMEIFIH